MSLLPESEPFLCLNMIVKNEAHIISSQLEKLINKIPQIDYWVISDTGSTDNTVELIKDFFISRNIQGELHHDEWKDFGHNRTVALNHAYQKSRYLIVFDADDEIIGDFQLPIVIRDGQRSFDLDSYYFLFGNMNGISYQRVQLINNKKRFHYVGVLHEWIECTEPSTEIGTIKGNYYTVSGRTGARSKDPDKYLKDALVLEKAHENALNEKNPIYLRYAFYCANSFYDSGKRVEDAIKWYKITLQQPNWSQEKYVSCLKLFECYRGLNQIENGVYYLVKAFSYDKERVECLYELVMHYCSNDMHDIAFKYYTIVKDFYENKYLTCENFGDKLFTCVEKYNFYLPYYMILLADKVKDNSTAINMVRIIFTKKTHILDKFYVGNFLYNLQFFLHLGDESLFSLFQQYVQFLLSIGYPVFDHEFMTKYEKYGVIEPDHNTKPYFSKEICCASKKILFYAGFSEKLWNFSYMKTNALGGSESAVNHLANHLPKDYEIYIVGDVEQETYDNIHYVNIASATNKLLKEEAFHTVIVSRYISFFTMFPKYSAYQTYIWAHDTELLPYGSNISTEQILSTYNNQITGCICQTQWHKELFERTYPTLKDKIITINNGIQTQLFSIQVTEKVNNRFLYSSCSERGLQTLLELWPLIVQCIKDAQLFICSYNLFPKNEEEKRMQEIIQSSNGSIVHLGKLSQQELHQFMSTVDYWLYTNCFAETSCITSLEMLASKVICVYYPNAGLVNTLGDYGIKVSSGNEIQTILSITETEKNNLRENGYQYAMSCSWKNRALTWCDILQLKLNNIGNCTDQKQSNENNKWLFILPDWFKRGCLDDYFDNLQTKYPEILVTYSLQDIKNFSPTKVTFVYEIHDTFYHYCCQNGMTVSYLNTEPLNIPSRLSQVINSIGSNRRNVLIYDYSKSNLHILRKHGVHYVSHLPYVITEDENTFLKTIYEVVKKTYDFGIISYDDPITCVRRQDVVTYLRNQGYSVLVVTNLWKEDRDFQLAKCKVILNIHGQLIDTPANIFEHIRCDRLLASGFQILSEESLDLDKAFIKQYANNLRIIPYAAFFEKRTYMVSQDNKPKIIDCFLFYKEMDMLKYRLTLLNDHVDFFVLTESKYTFTGKEKPLYYKENMHLFQEFTHKIIYVCVEDIPFIYPNINYDNGDQWHNECKQRNYMADGIKQIAHLLNDEDVIMVADLDEIPDPNVLKEIKERQRLITYDVLVQDLYYYNLESKHSHLWQEAKIISYLKYNELKLSMHGIRKNTSNIKLNKIYPGGWHMSYFGDTKFIQSKLQDFSHQEFNKEEFTAVEKIKYRVQNGLDLFGRKDNLFSHVSIEQNNYLPPLLHLVPSCEY